MAIIGALVYLEPNENQSIHKKLATLEDVDIHPVDTPNQLALVIEGKDLNQVHHQCH